MRGVSKSLLALAIVALLAFGLSACGSSSDDSTGASTAQEGTATTPSGSSSGGSQESSGGSQDSSAGDEEKGNSGSSDDSSSEERSDSFRVPGGDNSIQDYGEEPDESELEAAEAVLSDFMVARAKGDWNGMCATLSNVTLAPLEKLASRAPQLKGKGCAAILESFLASSPPSARANTLTDGVASLRVKDEQAFALYRGPGGVKYFIPMVEEDGEWKVGSLTPSEFP